MAPVIQRIKCSKLKTARCSSVDSRRAYCFSATHIWALSNARTSLQELCISDYNVGNLTDIMSDASMAAIATFSCLTRLDLICYGCPALDTLGQLSRLQKLALHLRHDDLARETCCEAVLLSNSAGLKKVRIDGHAWSDATYPALLTLTSLKVFALTVATISSPSAHVLGNLLLQVVFLFGSAPVIASKTVCCKDSRLVAQTSPHCGWTTWLLTSSNIFAPWNIYLH